jgi:hypothetical protein
MQIDRDRKRIADLVEVCTWALDALLGYEHLFENDLYDDLYKQANGPGATSIRDLRAIIAKETKPIETPRFLDTEEQPMATDTIHETAIDFWDWMVAEGMYSDTSMDTVHKRIAAFLHREAERERNRIIDLIKQAGAETEYGPVQTWAIEMVKQIEEGK